VSWASAKDAWETRAAGVFATETGGRSWHRIYGEPAMTILRLSATAGVIELDSDPSPCMCTTTKLWTDDDGATWRATDAIGTNFTGAAGELYWWAGGDLHLIAPFPPAPSAKSLAAKLVEDMPDGTIVSGVPTPGGFAFLVSSRVGGQHWDTSPRVLLASGAAVQTVTLPAAPPGALLGQDIISSGETLTVDATNFGTDPVSQVSWTSEDDGQTWALGS
jgi:hypothetical protein